jgi:hypothetical protein
MFCSDDLQKRHSFYRSYFQFSEDVEIQDAVVFGGAGKTNNNPRAVRVWVALSPGCWDGMNNVLSVVPSPPPVNSLFYQAFVPERTGPGGDAVSFERRTTNDDSIAGEQQHEANNCSWK